MSDTCLLYKEHVIHKEDIKDIDVSVEKRSIIKYKTLKIVYYSRKTIKINVPIKQLQLFSKLRN